MNRTPRHGGNPIEEPSDAEPQRIDLRTPLRLRSAFAFPVQSSQSRREVLIGAALLVVPVAGWVLNMGHRIVMTHRMMNGQSAWPAWPALRDGRGWMSLARHGTLTFLGMIQYHAPSCVCHYVAWRLDATWLHAIGAALWIGATIAVPGYMSHYCKDLDAREIFNPWRALRRVAQGGRAYWKAWGIALCALALSFAGLLALGVGFLITSVWFWQVAGFSFATVFTRRFALDRRG